MDWSIPKNQKDLRKRLGLANYLHKYSKNYANIARPLTDLLKKNADWRWENIHADTFRAIEESLLYAPILALPNSRYLLVSSAKLSDFAMVSTLLQTDLQGASELSHLNLVS